MNHEAINAALLRDTRRLELVRAGRDDPDFTPPEEAELDAEAEKLKAMAEAAPAGPSPQVTALLAALRGVDYQLYIGSLLLQQVEAKDLEAFRDRFWHLHSGCNAILTRINELYGRTLVGPYLSTQGDLMGVDQTLWRLNRPAGDSALPATTA